MPNLALNEKAVAKLKAPTATGKQVLFWDDHPDPNTVVKGFGVLVSGITNTKTYIVQRTLPGGRTRRVTIGQTTVLSLAEARKRAEGVLSEFYAGRDPKSPRGTAGTLRGALNGYLKDSHELRPASRKLYRRIVERHLVDWLDKPLREITPAMVQDRHQKIAETVAAGGRSKGHGVANTTMTTLGILFNFAADDSSPALVNPVRKLRKRWFDIPRRERMVKADDLPAFYKAVVELPNAIQRDVILLLLFTGMRKSEATGLRWEEIDFAAGMIRIPAARMKAGTAHDLPMNDVVRGLLVARRAIGKAESVFLTSNLRQAFRQIAETTGIIVSPHDLRRTFVTVADSCDISPMALKRLIAHTTSDVTDGYNVMNQERVREAAQRVADRMKTLCGVVAPVGNIAVLK